MKTRIVYLILISILIPGLAFAQMFGGPPSFTPDVLDNPIDGGLSLLLGAGAAYGAKRLRYYRHKKRENKDLD